MILVRYKNQVAAFVGSTRYGLAPELEQRDAGDVDRRRVQTVCEWALQMRELTGREPGELPVDPA